ncbi:CdaR family protein [Roseburia hominis]
MKKGLIKNPGLKALAFLFAVAVWALVANAQNPVRERTYTNIPVSVTRTEIITNKGNTYQISDETRTISVTVKAKKEELDKIQSSDIRATADMINLVSRSLIPIEISIPNHTYTEAVAEPKNVLVSIDASKTASFPITATTAGTVRDGYVLGSVQADPEKIEISGPEAVVDSIAKVVAEVNVAGLSKDKELPAEMTLYDAKGKPIDATLIEHNLGEEGLKVSVKLLRKKSVAVDFDTSEIETAPGYRFTGLSVQPEKIDIVGTEEQLEDVTSIEIPSEALVRTNLKETEEFSVDIKEYLPSWAKAEDETAGIPVLVKILVEKLGTKTIEFPIRSISVVNVPDGYKVRYNTTENLKIVITGKDEQELEHVVLEQGDVSINLVNYRNGGDYTVPVQIVLPDGIELVDGVNVNITLEKNGGGEDD